MRENENNARCGGGIKSGGAPPQSKTLTHDRWFPNFAKRFGMRQCSRALGTASPRQMLKGDAEARADLSLPERGPAEARDSDAVVENKAALGLYHRAKAVKIGTQVEVLRQKRLYSHASA